MSCKHCIPLLLAIFYCLSIKAQTQDQYAASPLFAIPKSITHQAKDAQDWQVEIVNSKHVPAPGAEVKNYVDRIKSAINAEKSQVADQAFSSSRELAPAPQKRASFHGNDYNGSHPNDNHIAVSSSGKIVSVSNTQFCVYQPNGALLRKNSLQAFADSLGGSHIKYDPRVIYQPEADRFIVVFLSGTQAAHSQVIVGFSATTAPEGQWHLYSLPGTPPQAGALVHGDYPQIGISKKDLFISLNLFSDNDDLYGSCIWQITAANGFRGDSLALKAHLLPGRHSLTPINHAPNLYDGPFYFVHKNKLQGSDKFTFYEIRTPLDQGGLMAPHVSISSGLNYYLSPDNYQKGSLQLLNNGDSRLQAAYRIDSSCYFVMPSRQQNKPAIYLGHLRLHSNGLANASLSASVIAHDTLELAFPNVAFAGYKSKNGAHAHAITFNYSSPFHYPGNGLVYVDTSDRVSSFSLNTQSLSSTGSGDVNKPFRWGDYTGIATRGTGEVWTAGYFIRADGHNSSLLTQHQVGNQSALGIHDMHESHVPFTSVYPNPAKDFFQIEIEVAAAELYSISLLDLQGKQVAVLLADKLWPGKATFRFSTYMLPPGLYFIQVKSKHFQTVEKLKVY